jgi:hypothetical protein
MDALGLTASCSFLIGSNKICKVFEGIRCDNLTHGVGPSISNEVAWELCGDARVAFQGVK